MTPAIGVGDLVVVHTGSQIKTPVPGTLPKYKIGDIVAFRGQKDPGTIVTHRVTGVNVEEAKILYETKGDANNAPDGNLTTEDKIIGKSTFNIPGLGKIFAAAKTKEGFLALVIAPAVLVIIFEIANIAREISKIRRKKIDPSAEFANPVHNNVLLRILIPFILATMFFQQSFASYADVESSNGNSLTAAESFSSTSSPGPSPSVSPSPSPSPSPTVSPGINEFLAHPSSTNNEWVEFYNPSGLDLTAYWLDDDTNFIDDTNSSAKKLLSSINTSNPQHPFLEYSSSFLNNGGDFVVLFAPDSTIVDQYQYNADPGLDISIGRSPDGIGSFQNCAVSTKGLANGGC